MLRSPNDVHVLILPSWYTMPYAPLRGIFFEEQAAALRKQDLQIGVIYPDFRTLKDLTLKNLSTTHFQASYSNDFDFPVFRFHGWNLYFAWLKSLQWKIIGHYLYKKYVRKYGKPDILYVESALSSGDLALFLHKKYNLPYIIREHCTFFIKTLPESESRKKYQEIFFSAAKSFAVGKRLADSLTEKFFISKIDLLPNCIDVDFFKPSSGADRPTKPNKFLAIGRLVPNKRFDRLIQAFHIAFKDQLEYQLDIVGDGPLRSDLSKLIVDLHLERQVVLKGPLDRGGIVDIMNKSHVLVVSSDYETFGVVAIEAMAMGIPVITTKSGGPEEFVNNEIGWVCESNSVKDLSENLAKSVLMYGAINKENLRNYVIKNYSSKKISIQIKKIILDTLVGLDSR